MPWYDTFARFYDAFLDGTYREHRQQARDALELSPGMTVVDVGCGTGASFGYLVDAVGATGRVIGADASSGMLRKAAQRARRNAWTNVSLMQVGDDHGQSVTHAGRPDRVLFFLSLSVIPAWESVLLQWYDVLAPGGRLVIADVHNARPGSYARLVELVARASIIRQSWRPLAERARGFSLAWKPSSWVLGGQFFIASGTKPSA